MKYEQLWWYKHGDIKLIADRDGDLFYLREKQPYAFKAANERSDLDSWHDRFGHVNKNAHILMSQKNMATSLNIYSKLGNVSSEVCTAGKLSSF